MAEDQLQPITLLTPVQEEIVRALKMGNTRQASYTYAGISKDTFYRWMRENRTFSDTVTRAEATAEVGHVGVLAQAGINGDWRASLEWLKRRRRDDYGDNIAISADKEAERIIASLFPEETEGDNPSIGEGTAETEV